MIQARDLRIGNLILMSFENSIETVTARTIGFINQSNSKGHKHPFEPIPLTEEWLTEKFKFDKDQWKDGDKEIGIWYSKESVLLSEEFRLDGNDDMKPLKSVHELMNLYFALTGEELTISE